MDIITRVVEFWVDPKHSTRLTTNLAQYAMQPSSTAFWLPGCDETFIVIDRRVMILGLAPDFTVPRVFESGELKLACTRLVWHVFDGPNLIIGSKNEGVWLGEVVGTPSEYRISITAKSKDDGELIFKRVLAGSIVMR